MCHMVDSERLKKKLPKSGSIKVGVGVVDVVVVIVAVVVVVVVVVKLRPLSGSTWVGSTPRVLHSSQANPPTGTPKHLRETMKYVLP